MRCAYLLDGLQQHGQPVDRSGIGKVPEVYPAAALRIWGFDSRGYKKNPGRQNLTQLVQLLIGTRPWLTLSEQVRRLCEESDDAFDALIASFVVRAVALGKTHVPSDAHIGQATREGWIHLPTFNDVDELVHI